MKKSSIRRNFSIIMILTIVSKITGFCRDALIAVAYGTTYKTDAYNVSLTIIILTFALIGTAVNTVFIPIFVKILHEKGRQEMFNYANKLLNILFIVIFILYIILRFQSENIVTILAPNFDDTTRNLTIELTRICMINLFFLAIYSVFMAVLQALQEFTATTLVGIVLNIPIIMFILLSRERNVEQLTLATMVGYIFQVLVQVPWLIKNKYKYKFVLDFNDKYFSKLPMLLIPVVMGTGLNQINSFVDQIMASGLQEGSISAINLSNKISLVIYGVFTSAIVTAVYPVLAGESGKIDKFKLHISKSICNISLITIPASVGIMLLSVDMIKIFFKRGAFNDNSVYMTAVSLFFLCFGIVFYGIRDMINNAFYSLQDTKTPMKNAAIGVCVNVILDVALVKSMGIGGLSLATSLSAVITAIFLYKDLRKRIGVIMERNFILDVIKIVISSCIMGGCIFLLKNFIIELEGTYLLVKLFTIVCISCLIYVLMLKLLKTDIFEENLDIIISKLKSVMEFKTKEKNKVLKDEQVNMRN